MDSVTQIALGASVSYAALGPRIGKRALLIGAIVGTLPDLDVLVPYEDAVASFTYHRSWSHSLIVLSICSWPLAWLIKRIATNQSLPETPFRQWWLAIWLVLITHPVLDSFTIYGTQIWWPLPIKPVAIGSIFIIDPLYTIPLIVGGIVAWRRPHIRARRAVYLGIILSSTYLAWTLVAQSLTAKRVEQQLSEQGIVTNSVVIAPFPTTLLWRIVAINDSYYFEGFSSLLDDDDIPLHFTKLSTGREDCRPDDQPTRQTWAIGRMDWFTNNAIALSRRDDRLIITDLRMGIEDDYVFEFEVGQWQENQYVPITSKQLPIDFDSSRLAVLLQRIHDQLVVVTSQNATNEALQSVAPNHPEC